MRRLGLERPPVDDAVIAEIENEAALAELRSEIHDAFGSLPARQRDALELRVVRGLPYAEVARKLGISEPAARARVSRSLSVLAHALDADAIGGFS